MPAHPPPSRPAADAQSPASQEESFLPAQRSYRDGPPSPVSATPPRSPPAPPLSHQSVLGNYASHMRHLPAQATPSGPASRSTSTAASPAAHKPSGSCAPAVSPKDASAVVPLLSHASRLHWLP